MTGFSDPVTSVVLTGVADVRPQGSEVLLYNALLNNNDTSPSLDVSAYESLVVYQIPSATWNYNSYCDVKDSSGVLFSVTEYLNPNGITYIPVKGDRFSLHNGPNQAQFIVIGTNKPLLKTNAYSSVNLRGRPAHWSAASVAMVVGTFYPLSGANATEGGIPTGRCFLSASLSTGTAARGILRYQYTDAFGVTQQPILTDTGEWHLDNPAGGLMVQKEVILPSIQTNNGNSYPILTFQCRVAGTSSVDAFLIAE